MIYHIADTHWGHKNIIKYEERPFVNVNEMDKYMIDKWNKVVDKNDIVYHHGDVFLTHTQRQFDIFDQLNGQIYIIKGNHDRQTDTKLIDRIGFEDAYDSYWLKSNILLTHRPVEVESNVLNIHGHIHGLFYENSKWKDENHYCVSVELIDYKPISFNEIMKKVNLNGI